MLNKFEEKAQKVIVVAESIAFDFGHSRVGSLHLLLSFMKLKEPKITKICNDNGITKEMIHDEIIELLGENDSHPFYMEYDDVTKMIINKAINIGEKAKESKISIGSLSQAFLTFKKTTGMETLQRLMSKPLDEEAIITKSSDKLSEKLESCQSFARIIQPSPEQVILERDEEVKQMSVGLSCFEKSNIALTGPAGVGKTAIVEEFSRILSVCPPKNLQGFHVIQLDSVGAIAGTRYRGDYEEKIQGLLEAVKGEKVIIFIDEGHDIAKSGATDSLSLSDMIKPVLARGDFKFIIATTEDEFKNFICKDSALKRRFRELRIQEPQTSKVSKMIKGKVKQYEEFHGVKVLQKDINELIKLLAPVTNRYFPDKILDVVDYTMAYGSYQGLKEFNMEEAKRYVKGM